MQVYFVGLKLLDQSLGLIKKSQEVDYALVNNLAVPLIDLLAQKVEEMNYRARDVSLQCLIKAIALP